MTYDPDYAEVERFVHRVEHLRRRKGLTAMPEASWIGEGWGILGDIHNGLSTPPSAATPALPGARSSTRDSTTERGGMVPGIYPRR